MFEPTMCSVTTAKVNDAREKVDYKYGEIEIGMSIYMDDISVSGGPEEVKKGIRKCARMEVEKKMKYSLSNAKYKGKGKDISGQVKAGNIQRTNKYRYLGITINEERNLKKHIEKQKQQCDAISRKTEIVGSRNQTKGFMPALIYGIEAWSYIRKGRNEGKRDNTRKDSKNNI